jgi:predicted lipoprotein
MVSMLQISEMQMVKTAGEIGSWLLIGGGLVALTVVPQACGPSVSSNGGQEVSPLPPAEVADVLAAVGPEVILPALDRLQVALEDVLVAGEAWGNQVRAGADGSAERVAAQEAWYAAMLIWQEVEVMQIGPLGSSLSAVAGVDLADEIYSWPTVNACRIVQETAEENWEQGDFYSVNLVNSYGLDALEHLFYAPNDNACQSFIPPNEDGAWNALGTTGVDLNRADYAVALIDGILSNVQAVEDGWMGSFGTDFAAGTGVYGSQQEALNAIFDAIFYIELSTKDDKLAVPMALKECMETACPDDVEATYSGGSVDWIDANLAGFELLFTGGEGTGMDDLLAGQGHEQLTEDVLAAVANAREVAQSRTLSLRQMVVDDPDAADELYDAVKGVTDLLKGDVATILVLEIPVEAAGDND